MCRPDRGDDTMEGGRTYALLRPLQLRIAYQQSSQLRRKRATPPNVPKTLVPNLWRIGPERPLIFGATWQHVILFESFGPL